MVRYTTPPRDPGAAVVSIGGPIPPDEEEMKEKGRGFIGFIRRVFGR